ncbi:RNA polymerase sigma-70 factor, ECF subfamily [Rhodococcus triatomae]|uniref:RNA polymerase sigma-70 factor, ECF subfamily n=1 Tax=Rhodococcus triatomae TaxID=300028 RepID=A0A1G8QFX5_9NOCA|nr:sigma-70 family RNA polymerase sigma factor [Rhodococcus triatomae]SDJ03506.1 RNA polymerase sigma-70 factor, ECF subfamily [Rhodococcus triatomae]
MTVLDGENAALTTLLARIAAGERQAFGDFYSRTSSRVYGMVVRVLRDPGYSEETTQEVYLQVWRSAGSFDPNRGSALSWLITLAHRRAIDRVRSEQSAADRESVYGSTTRSTDFDTVAEEVVRRTEDDLVTDCLESLTDIQRTSVVLAYYRGLTYREVAQQLSVSLPTIKSRIRDGLIRLGRCLGVGRDD